MPLCTCISYRCERKITQDGRRGNLIGSKLHGKHRREDQRRRIQQHAAFEHLNAEPQMLGLGSQLLDHGERTFQASLELGAQLPVSTQNAFQAVREVPKYAMDHQMKSVQAMGRIQDAIDSLLADVRSLPSPSALSDTQILTARASLVDLTTRYGELREQMTRTDARSGFSSVQAQMRAALETLDVCWSELNEARGDWEASIKERVNRVHEVSSFNTEHHFSVVLPGEHDMTSLVSLMIIVCQVLLLLPRRGCIWVLGMTRFIAESAMSLSDGYTGPSEMGKILFNHFPKDDSTITRQFETHLAFKSVKYAVCPRCHSLFKPIESGPSPSYPRLCNKQLFGRSQKCKTVILRPKRVNGRDFDVPIRTFISFSMEDYVSNLLSIPGFEKAMDARWTESEDRRTMTDVFHGDLISSFEGHDGNRFGDVPPDEGRYLFAAGFDFFNPLTNKQAGKRISVGVILLSCLNLPATERNNHMFLAGIIPGPHEPPLDTISSYFGPMVDAFLQFWNPGVYFSRTSLHPLGRLIRLALILIICDLLAARKIGGFVACTAQHYCTRCWCKRHISMTSEQAKASGKHILTSVKSDDGDDLVVVDGRWDNYDVANWRFRTAKTWRDWADWYRNAASDDEARNLTQASGVRWSELLRLPYFDPPRMIVIDTMHNLFLGVLKRHFQTLIRLQQTPSPRGYINITISEFENPRPALGTRANDFVRRLIRKLEDTSKAELGNENSENFQDVLNTISKYPKPALVFVMKGLGCDPQEAHPDRREQLAKSILDWRLKQEDLLAPNDQFDGLTPHEMEALSATLRDIVKPSWLSSVPSEFASPASTGKLKADQWRTLGRVLLPIALMTMWADCDPDSQRGKLLALTMELASAVSIATAPQTSVEIADAYTQHMLAYRKMLHTYFPDYETVPNDHMALHVAECLKLYGPVHGWWAFPFERAIGNMQRTSTNYKEGEYEKTIAHSFHRRSKLRAMALKEALPSIFRICRSLLEQVFGTSFGSLGFDFGVKFRPQRKLHSIPEETPVVLRSHLPERVHLHAHIKVKGITFTTQRKHRGNSNIMVKTEDGCQIPMTIGYILQDPHSRDIHILAHKYRAASVNAQDPLAAWPVLAAKMWDTECEEEMVSLAPDAIVGHFACCLMEWEGKTVNVVFPLTVSSILNTPAVGNETLVSMGIAAEPRPDLDPGCPILVIEDEDEGTEDLEDLGLI